MSGQEAARGTYRERNSTADRALDILTQFTRAQPVLSGAELADRLGVARSTTYRYLQSLVSSRFLEEAPGGGFRLGLRVLELAGVARLSYGLSEVAMPVMQALAAEVDATVLLTRRVGDLVVCVDRAEAGRGPLRVSYERGSTLPLNAGASALVLLAWSPAPEVRALLEHADLQRFTPRTVVDVDRLMERVEQIHRDGYALSRSELDHDIVGVAAPIRDERGRVTAAVSVAAVASRVPASEERRIVEHLKSAAAAITRQLSVVNG